MRRLDGESIKEMTTQKRKNNGTENLHSGSFPREKKVIAFMGLAYSLLGDGGHAVA